jgi:glycosyltransferase involved in cell wall biosynthesis
VKIAHITATFPPYHGGTGNVCYHNVCELARRGHQVTVFTAAENGLEDMADQDRYQVIHLKPLARVGNAPLLPQLASRLAGFEIIHLHYPFYGGEFSALAARRSNIPLVITYHQDVLLRGALGKIEPVLRHTSERWTLRAAERVLFTSEDYGQASHARPLLHGREEHIGVLPNGVDLKRFSPGSAPDRLADQLQVRPGDQVVSLVASLDRAHYFKGVEVLLAAMTKLPDNVHALIVGEGDLRPSYEARSISLGLSGRVHFTGRVSDERLPDYYRLADINVLPSTTMGEAFGLVIVEAFACWKPVIASNLPGVRSLVTEGVDGWLVEPGDIDGLAEKLQMALRLSPEQRRAMGEAGRRKVGGQFTWERIGEQLEAIYFDMIHQARYWISVVQQ